MNAVLSFILNLLLLPFYILFFLLFMVIWGVLTLTGVGPFIQYTYSCRDEALLEKHAVANSHSDIRLLTVPPHVNAASGGMSYTLCARYTVPDNYDPSLPPIALPNGLGMHRLSFHALARLIVHFKSLRC
jgi:hypothetical protein